MKRKVLMIILAISLGGVWVSEGAAGQIGYRMRDDVGFGFKDQPGVPNSAVMAFDAVIGRPLGAATTIVGAAVFIGSIPLTLKSDTTSEAAWGLVGRPYGWTFVRPLGRGSPEFEERPLFQP
jgi:hypothetical protein